MHEVDICVVGGGPAGICAAVAAARQGAKVLLVERYGAVGGNLTLGNVSPILGKVSKGTMYDEIISLLSENHQDEIPVETRNMLCVITMWSKASSIRMQLFTMLGF